MLKTATKGKSLSTQGSKGFASRKKTLILLSMVAPGAIWLFIMRYIPMGGIVMAFKNYKVYTKDPSLVNNIMHSEWNGIDNFKFIFAGDGAWQMFRNTLGYNIVFIVTGLVISVTLAIMLNEVTNKFVAKSYQTLMFFPYFLSWVVVSYFVMAFIEPTYGMINQTMMSLGHSEYQGYNWYSEIKPWPYILIIANTWKNVGYTTILYLAAITGIDATQYEAASIDGATKFQQIRFVTMPHLKTMIVILLIMNVGKIFNSDFGLFYQVPMGSGTLIPVTQTIDTYVYRIMTSVPNMGYSTAAGLMQNVIGFICIMGANAITRKIDEDSSLF